MNRLGSRDVALAPDPGAHRSRSGRNGEPISRRRATASAASLETIRRTFEQYFKGVLPPRTLAPPRLHAAIRYSALSPGKRLRPLLTLTACAACGGRWRDALPAAAAVECVHAFSLVHDDLPAMDDDDYRRGRLTTHKKFGEATAILAGDALIALGFEELTRLSTAGIPPRRVIEATRVLARAAGSRELIGGQALDLEAERRRTSAAAVREIHARKTGGMIRASLLLGGLVAGASRATMARIGALGKTLGFAFQIHDDLLNRGSTLERLGKRVGTDEARGKATYPRAVGEERARIEAGRLYLEALRSVEKMGPRAEALGRLILGIAERER